MLGSASSYRRLSTCVQSLFPEASSSRLSFAKPVSGEVSSRAAAKMEMCRMTSEPILNGESVEQPADLPFAVPKLIQLDAGFVEKRQVQVGEGDGFFVAEVAVA